MRVLKKRVLRLKGHDYAVTSVSLFSDAAQDFPMPFACADDQHGDQHQHQQQHARHQVMYADTRQRGVADACAAPRGAGKQGGDVRVMDLRMHGAATGDAASDAVRAMWVWPPSRALASFVQSWIGEWPATTTAAVIHRAGHNNTNAGNTLNTGSTNTARTPSHTPFVLAPGGGNSGTGATCAQSHTLDVLELGAGTGICGLFVAQALSAAGRAGAVWLTDCSKASLALMSLNVAANAQRAGTAPLPRTIVVAELQWGDGHSIKPHVDTYNPILRPCDHIARPVKRRRQSRSGVPVPVPVPHTGAEETGAVPVPPPHGFSLIIGSDIIYDDDATAPVWETVGAHLSLEPGATFVLTAIERFTLVLSGGIVGAEPVDTTLKAFVDAAAGAGFAAGEAFTPQPGAQVGVADADAAGTGTALDTEGRSGGPGCGGRVRTFVFCRL